MKELHRWFQEHQRPFPWRVNRTPYNVWISEVMLQQTRASVVVPYFERWLQLFPSIQVLASASLAQVIKAWEGLGYYSRARFLHQAAQQLVRDHKGQLPSDPQSLATIKGIGPYTRGAILSFGFHQRAVAIDGNVTRVLTRYFCVEEPIQKSSTKALLTTLADSILDPTEPWVTAEALIELGASICQPTPQCSICPLKASCRGALSGQAARLPIKPKPPKILQLNRAVTLIECEDCILVKKGESGKVMADLYEFPYFEMDNQWTEQRVQQEIHAQLGLITILITPLSTIEHSFTRYLAQLFPFRLVTPQRIPVPPFEWVPKQQLVQLPFSSGHRKILASL